MMQALRDLKEYLQPFVPQIGARQYNQPESDWDAYFMDIALRTAYMSKDPSTMVGAVLVDPYRNPIATGFNGFARGVKDHPSRYNDRKFKYQAIVHAETNAIYNAARRGAPTDGCTLYLLAANHSGLIWGGPPCGQCTSAVIQAGIAEVVSYATFSVPDRWRESLEIASELLAEAGVFYRELRPYSPRTVIK